MNLSHQYVRRDHMELEQRRVYQYQCQYVGGDHVELNSINIVFKLGSC